MAAHPLAISGKAATRNRGFMILSEQEMASALRGMTLATRGETRRTGAVYQIFGGRWSDGISPMTLASSMNSRMTARRSPPTGTLLATMAMLAQKLPQHSCLAIFSVASSGEDAWSPSEWWPAAASWWSSTWPW
ncbi:hypothetical protein D9M72_526920 [compost metagenome]